MNTQQTTRTETDKPAAVLLIDVVDRYAATNQNVQADRTVKSHRTVVMNLAKFLGRAPTTDDLTDDTIGAFFRWRAEQPGRRGRKLGRNTLNGEGCTLLALWKWCALRQLAPYPTIGPPPREVKTPRALTLEQLKDFFHAAAHTRQVVDIVRGDIFWPAFLAVSWQTGERVGAVKALRWDDIDLAGGWIRFQPGTRKGGRVELVRAINADAVEKLGALKEVSPAVPFGFASHGRFYWHWHALTAEACLPEWVTPHTIRKSVASHMPSLADACEMLGHSTAAITKRNYRDPTMSDGRLLLEKLPDLTSEKKPAGLLARLFGK